MRRGAYGVFQQELDAPRAGEYKAKEPSPTRFCSQLFVSNVILNWIMLTEYVMMNLPGIPSNGLGICNSYIRHEIVKIRKKVKID